MAFDPMEQRRIMGHFATGVTVITTRKGDDFHAMTANAVASLSLDPPLILVAVDCKATMHEYLKSNDGFAVNILTEAQEEWSRRFAAHGPKDYADIPITTAVTGAPIFKEALAHVECRVVNVLPGGDHDIFIGEIVGGGSNDGAPLMFYRGKYGRLR